MVLSGLSDRAESFTQLLTVILVFVLVLALTYLTTRFVGNYQKTRTLNSNFEVIDTYRVTNGKYLQIVKIGGKYVVIAIGKDNITSVCELSPDDIKPVTETPVQSYETFRALLDKARGRLGKGGSDNDK